MTMVERVAKAIEGVDLFSRYNDWTSDRVEGLPIEICQRSASGVVEDNVIVARFAGREQDCSKRLDEVRRVWRARAAIEAMRGPTPSMVEAGHIRDPLGCDVEHAESVYPVVWDAMVDAALKGAEGEKG